MKRSTLLLAVLRFGPAAIFSLYFALLLTGRSAASLAPLVAAAAMALGYFILTPVTLMTAVLRIAAAQLLFATMTAAGVGYVLAIHALPKPGLELAGALASSVLLYFVMNLPAWIWVDQ